MGGMATHPQFRRMATWLAGALVASVLAAQPAVPAPAPSLDPLTGWLDSEYEHVDDDYDAEDDPGSLENVAELIGIDDDTPTGRGIGVALIDTGVVPVDGLTGADVVYGPDFSFEDISDDLRNLDTNGHGTHLAGIIVGDMGDDDDDDDDERTGGLAPDARLISIKVGAADGAADVTQVIAAINWAIAHRTAMNIRVISLAYGTNSAQPHLVDPLVHAVERAWDAGIVVVVAGGNDAGGGLRSPASSPQVIAVGAAATTDDARDAKPAHFTNLGEATRRLDILAPGQSIVSLRNPGAYADATNGPGRVGAELVRGSGSSQASAIVSAAVAVVLEDRPHLTPDQVKALLIATAAGNGPLGLIDVEEALDASPPRITQTGPASTGLGSIDAARGSVRVADRGGVLVGETDIFGIDHSGSSWSVDAWSTNRWMGDRWAVDVWSGSSWSGSSWSGGTWSVNEWAGRWTGNEWSEYADAGNEWSDYAEAGNEWSGNEWSTWKAGS